MFMVLQHHALTLWLSVEHGSWQPLPNSIGPVGLYGFFIMLGVIMALGLGLLEGPKIGIKRNDIIDGLLIILPLAIIGTRLYYVLFHDFQTVLNNPLRFFTTSDGGFGFEGLAIHGGFIVAVVGTWIYTKKRNIDVIRALDLLAPGFIIAQASGRWGNFFNREAYGEVIGGGALNLDEQRAFLSETLRLPDFITNNMFINNNYHHPTFLYESVWNVVGFAIMMVLRRTKLVRSGDLFAFYLIWYSVGRFFIESLRTDSLYLWGTDIRIAQVISIIMILIGIIFIIFNHIKINRVHYHQLLEENQVQ